MQDVSNKLQQLIERARPLLHDIDDQEAGRKNTPEQWSCKEILGHLIDSASNNHQRFVRAVQGQAATFPTYDGNAWAAIQRYQELPWSDLVELWYFYNKHLSQVIVALPLSALPNPVHFGREAPMTLEFVVRDYLRHLQHHLEKILERKLGK